MRKQFASLLHNEMLKNDKIILITGDLGFGLFDTIRKDFPERFVNVGSAEQLLIGVAIGLYYEGFIPVCYSITPFLLFRPFELLRTYVNYEKIPLKLFGGGRDKDYSHDGMSHWACDDIKILSTLDNIETFKDEDVDINVIYNDKPVYVNLRRT